MLVRPMSHGPVSRWWGPCTSTAGALTNFSHRTFLFNLMPTAFSVLFFTIVTTEAIKSRSTSMCTAFLVNYRDGDVTCSVVRKKQLLRFTDLNLTATPSLVWPWSKEFCVWSVNETLLWQFWLSKVLTASSISSRMPNMGAIRFQAFHFPFL